jgi:ABC-2 type transport system permease protein
MRRFTVLTRMLLLLHLRDRETLFWFFAFPIGLLLVLGTIFSAGRESAEVAAWLVAGIIVMNLLSAGLNGDSVWLTSARDRGILQRVRATPLPPGQLVGAYIVVRLALVVIQSAAILATGALVFGARPALAALPGAAALTVLGGVVFLLMGQAIGALASSASAANQINNALFFPLLFLSNLVIQLDGLPATWIAQVARWSPAYQLVDLLRPLLTGSPATQAAWLNLAGLLAYGALALFIAARAFRWEPKR